MPIIRLLDEMGCSVDQLDGGNGRPDLLVGEPRSGLNLLLEVKNPERPEGAQRLNPLQKKYHAAWRGTIQLVKTVEQAKDIIEYYRRKYGALR